MFIIGASFVRHCTASFDGYCPVPIWHHVHVIVSKYDKNTISRISYMYLQRNETLSSLKHEQLSTFDNIVINTQIEITDKSRFCA